MDEVPAAGSEAKTSRAGTRAGRLATATVASVLLAAAVALPLLSLQRLGSGTLRLQPQAPAFGDGTVSFGQLDGWTTLQGGKVSACATTGRFDPQDVQQAGDLGPNDFVWCGATAARLSPDGVVITVSAPDLYSWAQPNVNFPESAMPPTLDPATCGVHAYEGQPAGTDECHVWITANNRQLGIYLWFGTESPGAALIGTAQRGLDALQVSEPASLGNDIAFMPDSGWHDQAVTPHPGGDMPSLPSAWSSNVALRTYDGSSLPAGPSNGDVANLPSDGVIVEAEQWMTTRNPLPDTRDFQPLTLPPRLSDTHLITGGWEGLAASDVSRLHLQGVVNGRPIIVQATFRTTDPSPDLVKQAQFALNQLVVVPLAPPTSALDDFGLALPLPAGWSGALSAYDVSDPTLVATTMSSANLFGYGPDLTRQMGPADTTIVLAESDSTEDLRWPQADEPPQVSAVNRCDGCEVLDDGQPPPPGHVLYRDTFTSGERAFDLYVEFGSEPTAQALGDVNALLRGLRITPSSSNEQWRSGPEAVGSLPDGQRPAVTSDAKDRTLAWSYEGGASLSVPPGWTGWTNLIVDSSEPLNLFAFGSWDVPQGGYCAPLGALHQLPSDGVLVWIDGYGAGATQDLPGAVPWPASPQIGPGTSPAPTPTACTDGIPAQSFLWTQGGRTFAVHVAFRRDATDANLQAASGALASFSVGR